MKVELYRHPLRAEPPEVFEVDSLAQWLVDRYESGPRVNFRVYAGEPSRKSDITEKPDAILRAGEDRYVVLEARRR
jgi:hypothetical protein